MYNKILAVTLLALFSLVVPIYADRDDFDSTKLSGKWLWDNPAKDSSYDLKEKPGWLKMTCAAGDHDIWDVRSGGPAVLLETPGDYTFETHYTTEIQNNCSVGLVFLNEDAIGDANSPGPWCALFSQPGNQLFWQHAVGIDAKQAAVVNSNEVFVKVEKVDVNWKFYYKAKEDDKWNLVIEDTYDIGKKHYAGLMVKNWNPGPDIWAYYDYVDVSWDIGLAVKTENKLVSTWGKVKLAE